MLMTHIGYLSCDKNKSEYGTSQDNFEGLILTYHSSLGVVSRCPYALDAVLDSDLRWLYISCRKVKNWIVMNLLANASPGSDSLSSRKRMAGAWMPDLHTLINPYKTQCYANFKESLLPGHISSSVEIQVYKRRP